MDGWLYLGGERKNIKWPSAVLYVPVPVASAEDANASNRKVMRQSLATAHRTIGALEPGLALNPSSSSATAEKLQIRYSSAI